MGLYTDAISLHFLPSDPCTYIRGKIAVKAMCAELRRVCRMWVVIGAPKRTWSVASTGIEKMVRRRAKKIVCVY
jgi:hypothetical protein